MVTEFDIIKKLRELFPRIGDDASDFKVLNTPIVSIDSFVVGEHFLVQYFTPYDMGYKSLVASISDIAACGGTPRYVLISIGLQKGDMGWIEGFYKGVVDAELKLRPYRIEIIGGDTVRSQIPFISVAVIGETARFVKRKGAMLGDKICVTGQLGSSRAGFCALKSGLNSSVIEHHLHPIPRLKEGVLLSKFVSSMIDISDGLIIDLSHILDESCVGAKLYTQRIPILEDTKRVASQLGADPTNYALYGGEDFELLFTMPAKWNKEAKKIVKFTEIGEITEKGFINEQGKEIPIRGFDHFACVGI